MSGCSGCGECHYSNLNGIILIQRPSEEILTKLDVDKISNVVNICYGVDMKGVASTFWGMEFLQYSRIYDLSNKEEIVPRFDLDNNGKLILPVQYENESCVAKRNSSEFSLLESQEAMRQILQQSRDHMGWKTQNERKGNYFMITNAENASCCNYGSHGILPNEEFEKMISQIKRPELNLEETIVDYFGSAGEILVNNLRKGKPISAVSELMKLTLGTAGDIYDFLEEKGRKKVNK